MYTPYYFFFACDSIHFQDKPWNAGKVRNWEALPRVTYLLY